MPQMEIYTSYSSGYLQNKVLEAADLVSVILGIFQCFDLHIITHIGVDLHMNDVAYFLPRSALPRGDSLLIRPSRELPRTVVTIL